MSKYNLVIVSNRLPVSVTKENGKLTFAPSSGGLATAMSSLHGTGGKRVWVGWPGISADNLSATEKATVTQKLLGFGCVPVFLTSNQIDNFYAGYANSTIWPPFHYFQSLAHFNKAFWAAYKTVNQLFANAVATAAGASATIWVHDYHLMLLPQMVREALPRAAIGFFLHIPFPSYEVFRILPHRKQILEGLLGADLAGFHTYDYARYFMNSVRRTLGRRIDSNVIAGNDRVVVADTFPIGIDYQKFAKAPSRATVKDELNLLGKHYKGRKVILSVDRLDYTKGIPNRLRAFEEFLKRYPDYHKKICLVMVAVPSRTEVQSYKDLRDTVEQAIGRINGRYATIDWVPISYQFKNLPFEQVAALYARADIALVTPLRDGMNLVAKEYVASKKDSGVLILSELTGAADELQEAVRINPYDQSALVNAIHQALIMPAQEQRRRIRAMQNRLSRYTVHRWASDFMEQLAAAKQLQAGQGRKMLSPTDRTVLVTASRKAKRRAFFLDYDGTLMPFVDTPDPAKAAPDGALLGLLQALAANQANSVHIVSGRTRAALTSWFGAMPITLVAEHGAWTRQGGRWIKNTTVTDGFKAKLKPVLEHYAERTPGASVEEKNVSLVWHYRNVSPELAYVRNLSLRREVSGLIAGTDIGIFNGNKVIEIKPRSTQKGHAVAKLLQLNPAAFVLCAGDDHTDEDMFAALPRTAYSLKVGLQETQARFQVATVEELRDLLGRVASASM